MMKRESPGCGLDLLSALLLLLALLLLPVLAQAQTLVTADASGNPAPRAWEYRGCPEQPGVSRNNVCLHGGAFEIEVHSSAAPNGRPLGAEFSEETAFWAFRNPGNIELITKVLWGCPINGHWWIFIGGLTDQDLDIRVADLRDPNNARALIWQKPTGTPFQMVREIWAFPCL